MNPLLKTFDTLHQTAPFSKIKSKHFKPAFNEAIEKAKKEVNHIIDNSENPTFKNTIEALAFSGHELDRISSVFFNLNAAETNAELQKIAQEVSPLLSEFSNDIVLNEKLFQKIKAVYNRQADFNLTTEQKTLLEKQYKNFVRNGVNLSDKDKKSLREIDKKLAKLKLDFSENVLVDTNAFELLITDEKELDGLPKTAKEAAKLLAEQKNKEGWLITLDYPSYIPVMTYANNRKLRKKLAIAFGKRGFQENENNNEKIVLKIADLRYQRANLLGYKTHSDFILEERMAEKPENVLRFLNNLKDKAKPAAITEFKKLENLAQKDGIKTLQKWDIAYYSEKLKQQELALDQEKLKPYFKLENVLNGVFNIAHKLYDLNFTETNQIEVYHKDVKTYEVTNNKGEFVAVFYADFFPRKGKRQGAWMTSFKNQWEKDGENSRPHVAIVCNFTKPTKDKPSLLTFNEVTTLFHEFGHALHGMLADTTYPNLSGTSVYWDFVELPSQILENWAYEKETLEIFAKQYETKEMIPMEWIKKIKKSANFLEGLATMRQISFGLLDMEWHAKSPKNYQSVKTVEERIFKETNLYPDVSENAMSTTFSHIFPGGYSSGYYSYKWAEVLDADAFAYFKENGIFNKEIAQKFKENILSKGGTEKPMILYKKFRGKEPNEDALLKRAGLLK
ncbi:MAG TPA: M3 family peptidase [Flavobacteriia bacterium]|nr:M3 family peptidase [Flavobacteriia bacterium]